MKIARLVAVIAGTMLALTACGGSPEYVKVSSPETSEATVEEEIPAEESEPAETIEEPVVTQDETSEPTETEEPEYSGDDEGLGEATPTEAVRESKYINGYECRPTPYDNYEFAAVISMNAYDGVEVDFESGYGVYDSAGNYTEYAVIDSNMGPLVYFLGDDGETLLTANHNAWDYTFIPNDEEAGLPPIVDRESGAYKAAEKCV